MAVQDRRRLRILVAVVVVVVVVAVVVVGYSNAKHALPQRLYRVELV